MSIDRIVSHQREAMLGRINSKVVEQGINHVATYPLVGTFALALSGVTNESGFYRELNADIVDMLYGKDIESEIYVRRAHDQDGYHDSRSYLRVLSRAGIEQTAIRKPLYTGYHVRYIVLDTSRQETGE